MHYFFKCLLTQIDKLEFELVPDLIVGRRRDADAAGFCDALKPSRYIDAVTENIIVVDNECRRHECRCGILIR